MAEQPVRVLLIDDDRDYYLLTRELLWEIEDSTYILDWSNDYASGLEAARSNAHDVILIDYMLGARTGIDLVSEALASGCRAPMVLLTNQTDKSIARAAVSAGAADYLIKGRIDASALDRSIRFARERRRAEDAIEKARTREIEIGANIQNALLLSEPPKDVRGLDIAAVSLPSQRVDGDFWCFAQYSHSELDVLIGDVMGKGVPAALFAAASKMVFGTNVLRLILLLRQYARLPDPEEIVAALHHSMTANLARLGSFITLCCARFEVRKQQITFVDAGHMRTLHYRPSNNRITYLEGDNLPIGVSSTELYTQSRAAFEQDDVFVFYSDGVTEARDGNGAMFGLEGLEATVRATAHLSAREIADSICDAAMKHANHRGTADDVTCLVVRTVDDGNEWPLQTTSMEVTSAPHEIDSMRRLVDWFCDKQAIDPPLTAYEKSTLVLAVSEAASNILHHAYWGTRDRRVQVTLEAYKGEVRVELTDWGRGFDPNDVRTPDFDGTRDGGFGVYIISQSVDDYSYSRDELGRNRLLLIRRAHGRHEAEPPPPH